MTPPVPPLVTVVVVTWNSATTIDGLLDSLPAATTEPYEVVVVDNGSRDDTVERARAHPSRPRVVANPRNRGLAAGNNQGLAAARGEVVLICNPDVVVAPGAVDALLACAARHPRAALVIARLTHEDGTLQRGVGDLPRFREAFAGRRASRLRRPDTGFWWDGWAHDEERQVGHGTEACYLVRRTALADVGGQDEGYRLDWEGLDWAARVAEAGWEVWFCPSAQAVHLGGVSVRQARLRWVVWSHVGMYRYFAARRPALRPVLALAVGGRLLAKLAMYGRADLYDRALRVDGPAGGEPA